MMTAKNVLVATDFSDASDAALVYGRILARTLGARLHVFHALENPFLRATFGDPETIRANVQDSLERRITVDDRSRLGARPVLEVSDHPAEAILAYAQHAQADLIVIGTHGRGVIDRWLTGSVAEQVVRRAHCPVLTVRSPEHGLAAVEAVLAETVQA